MHLIIKDHHYAIVSTISPPLSLSFMCTYTYYAIFSPQSSEISAAYSNSPSTFKPCIHFIHIISIQKRTITAGGEMDEEKLAHLKESLETTHLEFKEMVRRKRPQISENCCQV